MWWCPLKPGRAVAWCRGPRWKFCLSGSLRTGEQWSLRACVWWAHRETWDVRGDGRSGCPGRSEYGLLTALLGRPTSGDGTRFWRAVWNVVRVRAAFCVWTDEKRGGTFGKNNLATSRRGWLCRFGPFLLTPRAKTLLFLGGVGLRPVYLQ